MSAPVALAPAAVERVRLAIGGTVQGVGFRPFVWREAEARRLAGFVENGPAGVTIEVEGPGASIADFVEALVARAPPGATPAIGAHDVVRPLGGSAFQIRDSALAGARTAVVLPDRATCDACLDEVFDPSNRRFRYPFTNCTACGPRYSIVEDLPYDRERTSMRGFPMCAACRAEYGNPADRRFHAEPNACPDCGPRLALWDARGLEIAAADAALGCAIDALRDGRIVAVKGLGGFHLIVDARNEAAVVRLRQRKRRDERPFAVMFPDLAAVRAACRASDAEAALLTSPERPIVLLRRAGGDLAAAVAPRNPLVGAFLPYTPLHQLLLAGFDGPLVATSGNLSDEPIAIDEHEALCRLSNLADLFLVHDRPIVRPIEDSVARVVAGRPQLLRRARGYAPLPVGSGSASGILAVGGHLKTTVALTTASGTVLGPHVGDLDSPAGRDAHARSADDLCRLFGVAPAIVVRDLHPDYPSVRAAASMGRRVVGVQHHLAHVAALMAEHGLAPPVLGVAFDGTGYGTDSTVWGGEFLLVADDSFRRVAHLRPFHLPGGEAAIREPRRAAFGLLHALFGPDAAAMDHLAPVAAFAPEERAILSAMIARGINAPVTTSAGRLFDAVAALLGLRQRAAYEGQAAMELEWAAEDASPAHHREPYLFGLVDGGADAPLVVDWEPAVGAMLADLGDGFPPAVISARFHAGLAAAIAAVAARIGVATVGLTGGCFQNARLTELAMAGLRAAGLDPVWHEQVPPNDGGLALGQAAWAARLVAKGEA